MFKRFLMVSLLFTTTIAMATIQDLPRFKVPANAFVNAPLQVRRSVRNFQKNKTLNWLQVSMLFWAAQGVTDMSHGLRTAPSAGALYPLELYYVDHNAVWHYLVKKHQLKLMSSGDFRAQLSKAALSQSAIKEASADIVIAGVYQRAMKKYGKRGIRYTILETGHVAQNILLEAVSIKLAAVPIGAFDDQKVSKVLNLPRGTYPLYILPVGYAMHRHSRAGGNP
ncbi:MAG: SagB/ThcOx family dehydrogenase [Pseudomonadota bacterium]